MCQNKIIAQRLKDTTHRLLMIAFLLFLQRWLVPPWYHHGDRKRVAATYFHRAGEPLYPDQQLVLRQK